MDQYPVRSTLWPQSPEIRAESSTKSEPDSGLLHPQESGHETRSETGANILLADSQEVLEHGGGRRQQRARGAEALRQHLQRPCGWVGEKIRRENRLYYNRLINIK